ncbi:MAG: SDR family NAD(P)-dependent oxidoreductase [Pseudomonas sp.]
MNSPSLRGMRALVAGGSRGIGLAIAEALAGNGAAVSICARDRQALNTAGERLRRHGGPIHCQRCDLAETAQVEAWIEAAADALGGVDALVNNASGYGNGDDEASWRAGFEIDLMAAVRASRAALPQLRRSRAAAILNVSSINGLRPTPRAAAYSTAKAALNYYTLTLATELARDRIRVNAIAPGSIEFPGGLWDRRRSEAPELYARIRDGIPFGGFGAVEDVAGAALFLLSPQARWITGQVLAVDGGQSLGA